MTVYVAEIQGRGIAAFGAEDAAEAEQIIRDRLFRDDLMVLTSEGVALWDGRAEIHVRQALPKEDAKWSASRARAVRRGDMEPQEEGWVVFLVALVGPDRRKR